MFDLTVYTFNRLAGEELAQLPGSYAAAPPRRPARGRERDRLVLLLQFEERGPVMQGAQLDVLEKLASVYFSTRGTVTTALKTVVVQMNERLLARNLRVSKDGKPILGILGAAVLRDEMLFLVHAGPLHTYVINRDGVMHYHDPQGAGRGLGISRSAGMRFYRNTINAGDLVLLSAHPPVNWSESTLAGSTQLSLDNLRRRLLTQAGEDVSFLLLRPKTGSGEINFSPLRSAAARPAVPSAESVQQTQVAAHETNQTPEVPSLTDSQEAKPSAPAGVFLSGKRLRAEPTAGSRPPQSRGGLSALFKKIKSGRSLQATVDKEPEPISSPAAAVSPQASTGGQGERPWVPENGSPDFRAETESRQGPVQPVRAPARSSPLETQAKGLAGGILKAGRAVRQKSAHLLSSLTARILPGQSERLPALSTSAMIFIAVAVPLVIVAVATTVYIQNGRGEQHRALIAQARQMAAQAAIQEDPLLMRVNYEAALGYLDQAAEYGGSDEMRTLRNQVNQALDGLAGIRRVEFRSILPAGLDRSVQVSQIVASSTEDLYLLDQSNGQVIRLVYTRPGYELDSRFFCGPGVYGSLIVGPLVDIVAAPPVNQFDAAVIGLDAFGNLLYCSVDARKTTATSLVAPDAGWGNIQAMHYISNTLHVLDPRSNAVWRFEGFNLDFVNPPRFFFGNEVPDLADALDLAVYQNDLFVITSDGRLIYCTYSSVSTSPTRCRDPYPYRMSQAGQPAQELTRLEARFSQVQATQPPEPALYFFDPQGPAVYQFSLGMNFIQRMQPLREGVSGLPAGPASAFAVTSGRRLVLAYANQVFIGDLP